MLFCCGHVIKQKFMTIINSNKRNKNATTR